MRVFVLGTERVSYTSKRTGQPVSGVSLHCAFKDPSVYGESVDKIFISDNLGIRPLVDKIMPQTYADIQTNFRGNVTDVIPIPPEEGKPAK